LRKADIEESHRLLDEREAIADGWPYTLAASNHDDSPLYVEGDLLRADEIAISIAITYAPMYTPDGKVASIIANVRDITNFRKAQEMQSKMAELQERLLVALGDLARRGVEPVLEVRHAAGEPPPVPLLLLSLLPPFPFFSLPLSSLPLLFPSISPTSSVPHVCSSSSYMFLHPSLLLSPPLLSHFLFVIT